jgi:hypothetical protein
MQRWAYATVRQKAGRWVVDGDVIRGDRFQGDVFAAMGMNGWEMVAVDDAGTFHFKRPTRAPASSALDDDAPAPRTGSARRSDASARRRSTDVA